MFKNLIFISLLCLFWNASVGAQGVRLNADDISVHSQTTTTRAIMPIRLHSEVDATGLQFDLYLPKGILFTSVNKGTISKASHVVTSSDKGGYTRVVLYSSKNEVFSAKEGVVLDISVDIDTALVSKDYDVLLKNIMVSDASSPAVRYSVSDQHAAISVTTLAERINLSDVFVEQHSGTYKQLSANVYPAYTTDKHISWKSLNDDVVRVDSVGLVTFVGKGITDVVATTADGSNLSLSSHMYSNCSMVYADSIKAYSQSGVQTVVFPVKYQSNSDNTSAQFDLLLPEGFTVKSVEKGNIAGQSHIVTKTDKDGYTRFVCYSPNNEVFAKQVGSLAEITLEVDTALLSKDYDVLLKNIMVSDASSPAVRYSVSDQHTAISVTTLAERITFNSEFSILPLNQEIQLIPIFYPTYTTNKEVQWNVVDNSVIKKKEGVVQAVNQGMGKVSATTLDGSNVTVTHTIYVGCSMIYTDNQQLYSQSDKRVYEIPIRLNSFVDVSNFQTDILLPEGIKFISAERGDVTTDSHVVNVITGPVSTRVLCYSSNNEFFRSRAGVVLKIKLQVDSALVKNNYDVAFTKTYVSTNSNPSKRYDIPDWNFSLGISTLAESISLDKKSIEIYDGASELLQVQILPLFVSNKKVKWVSQDSNIAIVDNEGLVQGKKDGNTIIIVSTTDGSNISDTCMVRVNPVLAQRISISEKNLSLYDKQNAQLECSLFPENVTYKKVEWISDDASIVMVDATGYVHANKVGQTTIRVKAIDGTNLVDSCIVIVSPLLVTNISFESDTIDLGIGFEQDINTIIEPQDATDKSLIWESSDNSVVTINDFGRISTINAGHATITATSVSNSTIKQSCVINVHPITTSFSVKSTDDNNVLLEWKAIYNKYDISDYNVYVSENDKPFILWLPNTTKNSASFKGEIGKTYRFIVTTRDKNGNVEKYDENKCVVVYK